MKKQRKAFYLATHEQELAIQAFSEAMRTADHSYICTPFCNCDTDSKRFTPNMEKAWDRYVVATRRLLEMK